MLLGDVRLGAVGGDAGDRGAQVGDGPQVLGRADARDQQAGDLRGSRGRYRGGDQLHLVGAGEAVVERRPAEAVTVGDFQDRDAGLVEAGHDVRYLLPGVLVPDGVRAVAQRGVGQAEVASRSRRHPRQPLGLGLGDPDRGRGHDVQVARVAGR